MVKTLKQDKLFESKTQDDLNPVVIKGRWSPGEVALLKRYFQKMSGAEIAILLNRPLPTIRQKIFKLRLKKRTYDGWTEKEEQKLRELFPAMTNIRIAKKLKRSVNSIREKAHRMELKKNRDNLINGKTDNMSLIEEFSI